MPGFRQTTGIDRSWINTMMQSRTHTCGQLRLADAGKSVKIVGWMENVREVGGSLAFVVLRDFYGTTQLVVEDAELLALVKSLNKETTLQVIGVVRERSSKNPKQPTGDIEVVPSQIKVLGRCRHNELPFEINRSREADETQRLSGSAQPGDQTEHRAALQRGGRFAQSHDGTRFSGDHHPDSDRFLPRRCTGLSGAGPQASGDVLRAAPGAAAV